DQVFAVIAVKYCPDKKKLTLTEENRVLAVKSQILIPSEVRDKYLTSDIQYKISYEEVKKLHSEIPLADQSDSNKRNTFIANKALSILSADEWQTALASAVRENLKEDEINKFLNKVTKLELTDREIDLTLNEALNKALQQIKVKDYQGIMKVHAKKIISLAIAFYPTGPTIKTAFGPTYCQK
ncbi:MAG: hypothetical protein LBF22_07520, partial [Deltaproteobacteria bacterium]|nr:hypothetical protein [Deltaproteobacteria bacterium]